VVLSAINKNAALAEAISDPRNQPSVLSAFMRCAEMGLEPDGRRATINCYKKKTGGYDVTLIPMYQGLSELAMRSGLISNIHADKVCENDTFDWDTGNIKHKIDFRNPRGKAYAYYVVVTFKDGSTKTETMSKDEIEEIMKRSSAYQASAKYGKDCPWTTDFDEMAKKTVFRRCSKWLPLSPELRSAVEADDDDYSAINSEVSHAANDQFFQTVAETEAIDAEVTENPFNETVSAENLFEGEK
jgi:recombination protein RecT